MPVLPMLSILSSDKGDHLRIMSIFTRIRATRLAPANKVMPVPEQKADPVTPIPETEPVIMLVQKCAACGEMEATHPVKVGWFYLGRLPFVGVCEACYAIAQEKEAIHHLAQKKTAVSLPSVPVRRKRGGVEIEE